jgi:2-dehydropantoate 2-reductase
MRIAIYGSGGVGAYFGGRLAQIGKDVTFIARNENLTALRTQGLKVGSIAGDFSIDKVKVTNNPAEVGIVDYVLCCVKAWQVRAAAKAMKPMVGPDTLVVPLQNGVEAPTQLATILAPENVLGGLCAIVAFQAGPGHFQSLQWRQIEHSRRHTGGDVAEIHADHALERAWSGFPRTIGNLARTAGNARPADPGYRRDLSTRARPGNRFAGR